VAQDEVGKYSAGSCLEFVAGGTLATWLVTTCSCMKSHEDSVLMQPVP
jgi:hypothetical protein